MKCTLRTITNPRPGSAARPPGGGGTPKRVAQTDHGTFSLYTVADAQYVSMEMDHGSCVRRPASHPAGRSAAPHTAGHHDKSQMERNSFTGLAARESGPPVNESAPLWLRAPPCDRVAARGLNHRQEPARSDPPVHFVKTGMRPLRELP